MSDFRRARSHDRARFCQSPSSNTRSPEVSLGVDLVRQRCNILRRIDEEIADVFSASRYIASHCSCLGRRRAAEEFVVFKATCLKSCSQTPDDKPACTRHCDCTADELRKYKGNALANVLKSNAKVEEIGGICVGKEMTSFFQSDACAADCGGGEACKKSCSCMKQKIDGIGSPSEIGSFFIRFGKEDPAVLARMDEWKSVCKSGG